MIPMIRQLRKYRQLELLCDEAEGGLTEDGVDAPVIFRVVCDLGVFSENDLSTGGDHTELGDVDFDDGTLGQHTKLGVHRRLGVLLDTEDVQLERCLEVSFRIGRKSARCTRRSRSRLTMRDIRLFETQGHGSHEPLQLRRLPREALPNECRLRNHPLPGLALALTRLQHLEHLVLRDTSDFRQRHSELGSLVLPPLLDRTRHGLCIPLTLTVQQEGGQSTVGGGTSIGLLEVPLVVGLERLFELHLLGVPFLVQELGFDTEEFLGGG